MLLQFYRVQLELLLDVTKKESHEDTRGVLCQSMCEISQIAYESGVINHPDPFGGSETVE